MDQHTTVTGSRSPSNIEKGPSAVLGDSIHSGRDEANGELEEVDHLALHRQLKSRHITMIGNLLLPHYLPLKPLTDGLISPWWCDRDRPDYRKWIRTRPMRACWSSHRVRSHWSALLRGHDCSGRDGCLVAAGLWFHRICHSLC